METAQQSAPDTSSQLNTERSEVSPPVQPKPSFWKRALTQVYSPSGELTQKEFIFWAISMFIVSKIIMIVILLILFFSEFMVKMQDATFSLHVVVFAIECVIEVFIFNYPYINICNKRIKNIGIHSKYTVIILLLIMIACESAVWLADLWGINWATYALLCFFLTCKKSLKRKSMDTI